MQTQTTNNSKFPIAAVFTAEVSDFPRWKQTFEASAGFRREQGIEFTHVNHDVDNPNLLTVYLGGRDADRVRAFMANPQVKAKMQESGVVGAPKGELFTPIENTTKGAALAGAIVRQNVADFDQWKAAFDQHADWRASAGVIGCGISRKVDEPNVVVVYLQAESVDSLRALLTSPELAEKMKAGGVLGKPEIKYVYGEEPQH